MTRPDDSRRNATPEQHAAISTDDRNIVVVAGAGTGKTFVLVRRFVELLDRNPSWPISAIVAITFTNRAAGEMRARVRAELEYRRREATQESERRRWSDLLAQIEAARITTIHGLCSEIIRANAASAAIDPAFEVLDDTQAGILRENAVTLALAEAAGSGVLIEEERALALNVIARYSESEIVSSLSSAALLDADLEEVRRFEDVQGMWEQSIRRLLDHAELPELTLVADSIDDRLATQYVEATHHLQLLRDPTVHATEQYEALTALTKIDLSVGSAKKWPDVKLAKPELNDLKECAKGLAKRAAAPPDDQDEDAAELLRGWQLLIARTRYHYHALKQYKVALDYNDLERYAALVLTAEDVRARYINAEFRHVMVDEFQDTNKRQWEIVKAVAPPDQSGKLFLVGDPKQSIYSFRGADVTVFEKARREISMHSGLVLYLTESFRTHQALADKLNTVFTSLLRARPDAFNPDVFVAYDESQRLNSRRDAAPDIEYAGLYAIPNGDAGEESVSEAQYVARTLRHLVDSGAKLVWKESAYQPVRYGDIAVLLRSFRSKVEGFERALSEEGIPYITLGGQGFFGKREVRDLISTLKALNNPSDQLSFAAALHSPLFGVSDSDLLVLRGRQRSDGKHGPQRLPLLEALYAEASDRRSRSSEYDPVVFSADVLKRLEPLVGRVPVEALLQAVIQETGYMATLSTLPYGQQMRANVEKLVDRARDSGLTALNLFVRFLHDMTEAEAKEGGAALQAEDAVRITTVHSSKGLEYPVVWIADHVKRVGGRNEMVLNWTTELGCKMPRLDRRPRYPDKPNDDSLMHPFIYRHNDALRNEQDDAESLRVFYVAATRAQDALFLSGKFNKGGPAQGWAGNVSGIFTAAEFAAPTVRTHRVEVGSAPDAESQASLDFPLARTLPAAPPPEVLHLSASDVTALGGWFSAPTDTQKKAYERRLRRRVLSEQSEPVRMLTYDSRDLGLVARRTGTLIHDALRYGYDVLIETDKTRAMALIRAMAWENGITQADDLDKAVDTVIGALMRYRHSDLCRELEQTQAIYRELPFVYKRDGNVIHGVIDLLYRGTDGVWTVVDYKTDKVDVENLRAHARTYHLQMAVYAEAVEAQTGREPRVMLVFLRHPDKPVLLSRAELNAELESVPLNTLIEILREEA